MTDHDPLADQLAELIDSSAEPLGLDEVIDRVRTPAPARRRPARRTVAIGAAVGVLVVGAVVAVAARHEPAKDSHAVAVGSTTTAPDIGSSTPTTSVESTYADASAAPEFGVIGPGSGWALNGLALYRTDDDGAHWRDITPPAAVNQDPVARITTLDFLDSQHVWAPVALNDSPFTIYASSDGGTTWNAVCRGKQCPTGQSLDFIDARHGWGLGFVPDSNFETGELFSTSDGGHTWTRVGPTPFDGPMHFVSATDGWAVSNAGGFTQPSGLPTKPGGDLYRTQDGGRTWQRARMPKVTNGLETPSFGVPQFFGADGVVVAWLPSPGLSGTNSVVEIYTTHDGGDSWTGQLAPSDPDSDQYGANNFFTAPNFPFAAASPNDWMLFIGPHLYVTHDAGGNWTTLTPRPAIKRVYALAMMSVSTAWAAATVPTCDPSKADHCTIAAFVHTTDGGKTWPAFYPH